MSKTTCVSVRMRGSDVEKIKDIARRLDVSDSDIYRFGMRLALSRLIPLLDTQACGFRVLPVFVENDAELIRHFDLDASHLDRVINSHCAQQECRVESADLNLLALNGKSSDYLRLRLQEILGHEIDPGALGSTLRTYLYGKYSGTSDIHEQPTDEPTASQRHQSRPN